MFAHYLSSLAPTTSFFLGFISGELIAALIILGVTHLHD